MPQLDQSEAAMARTARLFVIGTGTLSTAHLPFWLNWLSVNRPNYSVTVGLTATAHHFVSATALAALTKSPVVANTWTAGADLEPIHTAIAANYDALIVYPASMAFISGLASASGTSPFFLAALGTSAPVVIAPSFPPGVADNPLVVGALQRISSVSNFHVVPTQTGTSASTGGDTEVTAPLWDAIATFESTHVAADPPNPRG